MKKSQFIYIYDGTFIGLLNLINYLLHQEIIPLNIKTSAYSPNLFEETINLKIPVDKEIISKIIKYMGIKIFNVFYYLYLTSDAEKEILIFYFWLYSLKYPKEIFLRRDIPYIAKSLKLVEYVSRENHKLKGFVRFRELKSKVLYAEVAPTNNCLPLLVKHFQKRLKYENWLIWDKSRNLMGIYLNQKLTLFNSDFVNINMEKSLEEEKFVSLWQTFYKSIAIPQRKNERLRQSFMPKKYWQYIIEMEDEV